MPKKTSKKKKKGNITRLGDFQEGVGQVSSTYDLYKSYVSLFIAGIFCTILIVFGVMTLSSDSTSGGIMIAFGFIFVLIAYLNLIFNKKVNKIVRKNRQAAQAYGAYKEVGFFEGLLGIGNNRRAPAPRNTGVEFINQKYGLK